MPTLRSGGRDDEKPVPVSAGCIRVIVAAATVTPRLSRAASRGSGRRRGRRRPRRYSDRHAGGYRHRPETVDKRSGAYTVPYLSVGTYDVTATLAGFTGARVTDVNVRVGLTATVDLSIKVASVQTEITVSAHTTDLELQSPALGNVVTGRQMIELPIVGRNPYSLVTLAPGVVDRGNTGTGPLINGARSNSTAVLLDGAEQRNSTTNDLNYSPRSRACRNQVVTKASPHRP